MKALTYLFSVVRYTKARLSERSTWLAISVGVTGAAALASPWSYVFIACGVIGALVPSQGTKDDSNAS